MRLLRSEFLRARSRRLVWMVLVGGVVASVVALGILAFHSSPPSQADLDATQQTQQQQLQRCLRGNTFGRDGSYPPEYDSLEEACRAQGPYFSARGAWLHDLPDVMLGIATFVVLLGAWLGASLAGADWTNNTMMTLLTWEPRRIRVLLVRALVVAVVIAATTLFLQVVFAGIFALVATWFGTTAFTPPDLWNDVATTIARVCVIAISIGLVAYAIAMVGRSTVASLGVLFGYLILFEGVIAGFKPQIQSYLLVRAAGVILSQMPILDYSATSSSSGSGGSYSYATPALLLDVSGARVVVAAYVIGLLALALVVFRRRDVT